VLFLYSDYHLTGNCVLLLSCFKIALFFVLHSGLPFIGMCLFRLSLLLFYFSILQFVFLYLDHLGLDVEYLVRALSCYSILLFKFLYSDLPLT
jgi:hypothetical protein